MMDQYFVGDVEGMEQTDYKTVRAFESSGSKVGGSSASSVVLIVAVLVAVAAVVYTYVLQ
jgi:hypothetical protein